MAARVLKAVRPAALDRAGQQSGLGQMSSEESGGGATVPDFCGESPSLEMYARRYSLPGRRFAAPSAGSSCGETRRDKVDQQLGNLSARSMLR